ncbi:photosystem II reaction center protein PsbZ [Prochlorococcus sp. MIT 1314]|uniref:photosystem II reaction center protein PsbZ n=1 Tax=Prochlorococcus sp. MIT 1314 TaxID=3096220 RepID=UPI002A75483D|nr:photosystem II reaction center protein PsbZ [Prochlorococcus sp. MIT 1314]
MQAVNFFFINALLFSSLIAVVGVPYLYATQTDPSDRRNPEIKKVEIIGGVWFHLVLINGVIAGLV